MKKKRNRVVFLVMLLLLAIMGCGSGSDTATEKSLVKISNVPVITDESKRTEKIPVLINESFNSNNPDFEKKSQDVMENVNAILNRNSDNKKQFLIDNITSYQDAEIMNMHKNGLGPEFSDPSKTVLVLFIYDGVENKPKPFRGRLKNGFNREISMSNGETLHQAWIAYDIANSPFTNLVSGTEEYEKSLQPILHEMIGHPAGLGELYRYRFSDSSGLLPRLADFYPWLHDGFLNDPMFDEFVPFKFSDFNNWLININSEHIYTGEQIGSSIPKTIKVKVVDDKENLISGATVRTFAALWGNALKNVPVTSPLQLLETVTDKNGEAIINSDDAEISTYKGLTFLHKVSPDVAAKIIKVEYDGGHAGTYMLLYDLERAYLKDGLDEVTIILKLEWLPF